jgi:hypothetical protein
MAVKTANRNLPGINLQVEAVFDDGSIAGFFPRAAASFAEDEIDAIFRRFFLGHVLIMLAVAEKGGAAAGGVGDFGARIRLRLKFARWCCHLSVSHKSGVASGTGGNLNPSPVLSSRRVSGCGAGCRWVNHAASSRNCRTIARSGAVTIRAAMRKAAAAVSVAFRSLGGKLWFSPRGSRYPRLLSVPAAFFVALALPRGLPFVFLLAALLCCLGGVPRIVDAGVPFGLAALLGYLAFAYLLRREFHRKQAVERVGDGMNA